MLINQEESDSKSAQKVKSIETLFFKSRKNTNERKRAWKPDKTRSIKPTLSVARFFKLQLVEDAVLLVLELETLLGSLLLRPINSNKRTNQFYSVKVNKQEPCKC